MTAGRSITLKCGWDALPATVEYAREQLRIHPNLMGFLISPAPHPNHPNRQQCLRVHNNYQSQRFVHEPTGKGTGTYKAYGWLPAEALKTRTTHEVW